MTVTEQAKRLFGFGERANGNTFLALMALTGIVGWGMTALQARSGGDIVALVQPVTVTWTAVWLGVLLWAHLRVDHEAVWTLPTAVWVAVTAGATAVNGYAIATTSLELVWLPWLAAFAVGYLATALLVERSGVYWLAGLASAALLAYGIYAAWTGTGHSVVGSGAAAIVLEPVPYTWSVLGALHVLPTAVDATRSGRQVTDAGVPALRTEEAAEADDEAGGVVPQ